MAIPSFYHPSLTETDSIVELSPEEAAHAAKARRLKVGHAVRLFNGKGLIAHARLHTVERRMVSVEIDSSHDFPRSSTPGLSLAVAIPKGDRQKVMIDMLTQLGVFEIVPIECEHSVTRFSDNMREKWCRAAIEAAKQSQNPWLPTIVNSIDLGQLLGDTSRDFIYADADADARSVLELSTNSASMTVLIGPEGGFSENEIALMKQQGAQAITLGKYILRTEAAAISVAAQWNARMS